MNTSALLSYNWREKFAAEQDLEKSFMDMAYQELQEKAAPLMKGQHRLGFEIVDKNENNSRLVGIFAFKIGKNLYYAPIFFLNGQLKGTDLFYSHSTKSFIPLQEKWLDYLMKSQQSELGTAVDMSTLRGWRQGPNFWQLLYPPGRQKMASAEEVEQTVDKLGLAQTAKAAWLEIQLLSEVYLKQAAEIKAELLPAFLKEDGGIKSLESIVKWMENSPKFAQAMAEIYPNDEWLVPVKQEKAAEKKETITVITTAKEIPSCSLERALKEKLISRNYAVLDTRDQETLSRVYSVSYGDQLSNPTESGLYSMQTRGGKTVPALILKNPMRLDGNNDSELLVIIADKKRKPSPLFRAENEAVFVDPRVEKDSSGMPSQAELPEVDLKNWAEDMSDLKIGKVYVLVDAGRDLHSVGPVKVTGIIKSNDKVSTYQVTNIYTEKILAPKFLRMDVSNNCNAQCAPCGVDTKFINLQDAEGGIPRRTGEGITVPSRYRAIEVEFGDWNHPEFNSLMPGTFEDVQTKLAEAGVHTLEGEFRKDGTVLLRVDGIRDNAALNPDAAILRLMGGCHFKEADAEQFIDLVKKASSAKVMFKNALSSRVIQVGEIPDFYNYFDPELGANGEMPQRFDVPISNTTPPPPEARIGDKYMSEGTDGISNLTPEALVNFADATQSKAIFDHGIVGQLAKTYSAESAISQYLDKMMGALDAIGRTIFLYYWKQDEFVAMYGSDDMPDMEAKLIGCFKNFGDLIIDLKTKSLTGDKSEGKNMPV